MAEDPHDILNRAYRLREEIWEIGLAVLSHRGACRFFQIINDSLDSSDLKTMAIIGDAVEVLPASLRAALSSDTLGGEETRQAVLLLEDIAMALLEGDNLPID